MTFLSLQWVNLPNVKDTFYFERCVKNSSPPNARTPPHTQKTAEFELVFVFLFFYLPFFSHFFFAQLFFFFYPTFVFYGSLFHRQIRIFITLGIGAPQKKMKIIWGYPQNLEKPRQITLLFQNFGVNP